MTCNLVTLLLCICLVTLVVGKIYVPIHDVRTAVAVLNVAPKTCQLWRRKALRHADQGMSLKFKEHHPRNSDSHTLGGREQIRAFWALKNFGNGISRFPSAVISTVLCVFQCISRNERVRDGKRFKIVTKCWICITRGLPIFSQFFIVSLTLH